MPQFRFMPLTILALLLLALPAPSPAASHENADRLVKIAEGVYGYVNEAPGNPGNVYAANVGVIIGEDAVLVVDTLTSHDEALALIEDIRKITDKPIRFAVNTHYHLDHALGNSAFEDIGAMLVSHAACREQLMANGPHVIRNAKAFHLPADFWKTTRIVPASLTFERFLKLDLGNLPVELIHTGRTSHSPGSILVYLPKQSILFTGDILFTDVHPYMGDCDIPGWIANLDWILAQDAAVIVPGHGPLSTKADVQALKAYLPLFDANARELAATKPDLEAITAEMLKRMPEKAWGDFIVGMNIKVRYLKGGKTYE